MRIEEREKCRRELDTSRREVWNMDYYSLFKKDHISDQQGIKKGQNLQLSDRFERICISRNAEY